MCEHQWAITKAGEMVCINCRENILDILAAANARIAELENKLTSHAPGGQQYSNAQFIAMRQKAEQSEAQNKRMREALERIAACLNQSEHNAMIALQIAEQWEQMGEKHEEK